ncbi:MAG: aspartyl/asparaginyl beta-hydroxylase domain-containing protein [Bacteroidia bacterium]|nr:aspartyl/asparaginyl beta-hydroxylase domain-containing protein [Bacteroidia bacterium]
MKSPKAVYFITEQDQYRGPEPAFYDKSCYAWVQVLEDNWEIIREEMAAFISGNEKIELSSTNPPYLSDPKAWKNIYFLNFMWAYHHNIKRFPKTYALLKSIPNLTFAEFTVLEPHSRILPHIGETNATIRGHLGISIPYPYPAMGIHVGDEEVGWENGKAVLFSDACVHHVWNNSDKRRFVLVFDVIRDEFASKKTWVCAQSLGALTVKWFAEYNTFFNRLPRSIKQVFFGLFSICWLLYLPIQRRIQFLP